MPADSATHTFEFAGLWGANAPWHQRVSCTCQLTLSPTLLSLRAIAFAGPLLLMDPSMGPRWHKMEMRGQDIWRANVAPGWGDCSWQSIATYSTCSPPMASTMELYWELRPIVGG